MSKAKLVGMICKERLQTLEENHPLFWNKESPHTLLYFNPLTPKRDERSRNLNQSAQKNRYRA